MDHEHQDPNLSGEERAYAILRKAKGINATDAHAFTIEIKRMAAANLIYQFGSKLDAQTAVLKEGLAAQKEKQDAKFNMLLWMFGTLIVLGLGIAGLMVTSLLS